MDNRELTCPECARPVRAGIAFCPMCGVRLDGAPTVARNDHDFIPLQYTPVRTRRRKRRKPREHAWQFWRPRHFSLR